MTDSPDELAGIETPTQSEEVGLRDGGEIETLIEEKTIVCGLFRFCGRRRFTHKPRIPKQNKKLMILLLNGPC